MEKSNLKISVLKMGKNLIGKLSINSKLLGCEELRQLWGEHAEIGNTELF